MTNPADSIEIQNVVASTGIGQELDLEALAEDLPGADFNPDNFPGLVYRTQEPKAAALIFRSGKIVCTGAKASMTFTRRSGSSSRNSADCRFPSKRTRKPFREHRLERRPRAQP